MAKRSGPAHTITRFTAAKKTSHPPGSLGLSCLAKVVRETPMQTLKLETFQILLASHRAWGCHPVLLTVYYPHSVFPIAFAARFHLASTSLCLLNSDAFIALSASKGWGASFQPWQNTHLYYGMRMNRVSSQLGAWPCILRCHLSWLCLAWFPQYLPCLKLLDYLHLMQKYEQKRWCLLLFYQDLPPTSITDLLLSSFVCPF